jgi:hypothetical protein
MALRKGHGNGAGVPRIEVLPPDELPAPVAGEPEQAIRRADGTIADSATAKALGARGGLAKSQKKKLLQGMGLADMAEDNSFTPYYRAAQAWLEAVTGIYAAMCGGALGPGPSALLGNAAIALAMARYLTDKAFSEQNELHSRQATRYWDAMKQQKLAAYELGVREAKMRADLSEKDGLDAFEAALRDQNADSDTENGSSE